MQIRLLLLELAGVTAGEKTEHWIGERDNFDGEFSAAFSRIGPLRTVRWTRVLDCILFAYLFLACRSPFLLHNKYRAMGETNSSRRTVTGGKKAGEHTVITLAVKHRPFSDYDLIYSIPLVTIIHGLLFRNAATGKKIEYRDV